MSNSGFGPLGAFPLATTGESEAAPPETITQDKWNQPTSQPTYRRGIAAAVLVASGVFWNPHTPVVAETVTLDKWHSPLSQPIYRKGPTAAQQAAGGFYIGADPFPERVSADKWAQPTSQPTYARRRLQPDSTVFAQPEGVTAGRWLPNIAEPTRRKGPHAAWQQATFFAQPEDITPAKWAYQLSQPTLRRRPQQPEAAGYSPYVVVAETVTVDKWHGETSPPRRRKPAFSLSTPAILDPPWDTTTPGTPAVFQWYIRHRRRR